MNKSKMGRPVSFEICTSFSWDAKLSDGARMGSPKHRMRNRNFSKFALRGMGVWRAAGSVRGAKFKFESTAVHGWVVGSCGALSKGDEENWQQQSRWFSIIQSLDRRLPAASERICKCLNQLIIAKGPKERFWVQKGNDNTVAGTEGKCKS